jgi:hypothetical protein
MAKYESVPLHPLVACCNHPHHCDPTLGTLLLDPRSLFAGKEEKETETETDDVPPSEVSRPQMPHLVWEVDENIEEEEEEDPDEEENEDSAGTRFGANSSPEHICSYIDVMNYRSNRSEY